MLLVKSVTWSESPTLTKNEDWSAGTETQLPSLREIWSPLMLLERSTEMTCGSVCSPKPVRPKPGAPLNGGHGG